MGTSFPDLRVRRTRRLLFDAVLTLAARRDFAEITVQDITRHAEVNRSTFYLHFRDKDDLVTQALDELFEDFTAEDRAFVAAHTRLTADNVPSPVVDLFRHIAERRELFRRLLAGTGSSAFAAQLRAFHERQFMLIWHEMGLQAQPGSPPPELRARFGATALQGVIGWWLNAGPAESIETMARWVWDLLRPLWFADTVEGPG